MSVPADIHVPESVITTPQPPSTVLPPRPASRPARRPPGPGPRRPRPTGFLPVLLPVLLPVVLSLALGLWGVRRGGSLWRDEVVTYDMARRELPQLWGTLANADAVHGLYYLLMHGLFRLTGDSADPLLVLRLPSVLATAVACGTLALLGLRLAGPRAGLLAGLTFAVLPQVQRFAQEGRSYAIVCALVIWATYLLVRAVETGARRIWAGYAAVLLGACLLHEFAVLALLAHAVAVPVVRRRAWLHAALPVCVLLAPLALLSVGQSEQVAWIGGIEAVAVAAFVGMSGMGVACAALLRRRDGLRIAARDGGRPASGPAPRGGLPGLALALLIVPPAVLLLVSLAKPLYSDRYVLYANAGAALLIGAVLARVRPRTLLPAGAAVLALVPYSLHLRTPESRLEDVTAIAETVRAAGRDADAVVYLPGRRRVWSLADPASVGGLRDLALAGSPAASHTLYGVEADADTIRARMLATPRILAVGDPVGQPLDRTAQEAAKREVLDTSFEECRVWRFPAARIVLYARPGHC
ncbi:glycosyltransferase family 39 protein [Streptomyces sp. NPDC056716]|uniref:glycosyltransferase family 39 protein n=1 Tax=unclassified Streptomyces TaxID=2593676 RepID=UPI0036BA2D0A